MAAVNYTSARFSAEDDNGRPLIGGRLFTYQNGTTTPAVTYQDAAGTVPNTNPIILNARGEAVVYLSDAQVYTFVLQNRFGSVIWTQNDIVGSATSGSVLGFITNLASAAGAGLVGFLQRGTGAVLRTVLSKLQDFRPTVEDFGAVGNGTADDTAAFRRAVAVSQLLGIQVGAMAGKTYKITGNIELVNQTTGRTAKLVGPGSDCCVILPVGNAAAFVHPKDATVSAAISAWGTGWGGSGQGAAFKVLFGGFEINGSGATCDGLNIRRVGLKSRFFDLDIHEFTGEGMRLQSVFDHSYRDIEVRACSGLGVHIYESKSTDPDGFQECSQLHFDSVYAIHCNGQDVQWKCEGGDNYTFLHCKPSEGKVGFDFVDNSVGHTLVGTYVDGQTTTAFDNIGIRIGQGCFGIAVTGGRYWNVRYAVDFVAGGRSSVSAVNVVFDSPIGSNVYDVRLQSGVQQIVDVSAGLNVLNQSTFALRQAVDSSTGTYTPVIFGDADQVGAFTYTTQYGEWRITNRVATVKVALVWTARPTAGIAFGISLPFQVPTRGSHFSIRSAPAVTIPNFTTLGHFANNSVATKLYFYVGAGNTGANIAEIPATGALIAEMTFFLD